MRKIATLAALALTAAATPALADDADATWTGAYIGISGGYTETKSDQTVVLGGNWSTEAATLQSRVVSDYATASRVKDINYGGQIGYNVQAGSSLVIGLKRMSARFRVRTRKPARRPGARSIRSPTRSIPRSPIASRVSSALPQATRCFMPLAAGAGRRLTLPPTSLRMAAITRPVHSATLSAAMKSVAGWSIALAEICRCGWNMSTPTMAT